MARFITGFALILAAGILLYAQFPISFYFKPAQERLFIVWQKDFAKLSQDKKFAQAFNNIAKIEVNFTDPQVAEEFDKFRTPFKTGKPGGYILKIGITRWIEKGEYGFVVQHEIFDSSDDKLYEFGRTYKIGYIF